MSIEWTARTIVGLLSLAAVVGLVGYLVGYWVALHRYWHVIANAKPRRRSDESDIPKLEWVRTVKAKTTNDYSCAEVIPPYTEFVPDGPGQWYLDGEPVSDEQAQAIRDEYQP